MVDDVGQESPAEPGVGFGQDAAGVVLNRVHRRALVSPFLNVEIRGGHEAVEHGFAYLDNGSLYFVAKFRDSCRG